MPEPKEGNDAISQEALDALLADMADKDPNDVFAEAIEAAEATDTPASPDASAEASSPSAEADTPAESAETPFDFATFQGGAAHAGNGGVFEGFERVQDIPLEVTVELGRTKLLIRDILELETGAIIELEKMAGEPVDLLANGLLVARGEVVVIEDNFGVRITEIITQTDRKEISAEWAAEERRAA